MRRLTASRAWAAVAVVAAIVAVLAVMFPGLGFGQTTSSHGGSPSDVYTQGTPFCTDVDKDGETAMTQTLNLTAASTLLVYFSYQAGALNANEEMDIVLSLDGTGGIGGGIPGNNTTTRNSGTLMGSFVDVPAGTHTVDISARVDAIPAGAGKPSGGDPHAGLGTCQLAVFVIPPA